MRHLISGAAGFIGSHLCERLLADGGEVVGLDNLITGSRHNIKHLAKNGGFRFQEFDVTQPVQVVGKFDYVWHLASLASPKFYLKYPIETLESGSTATRNMLEIARRDGARFLVTSTSESYGDPLEHPQVETYWGNVNPVGLRSCYDESKRYAEALTMAFHRTHGVRTNIARIFNTYGPRMRPHDGRVVSNFVVQSLQGKPLTLFGNGNQTRSFCYVDDLVRGITELLLIDSDKSFAERTNRASFLTKPEQPLPETMHDPVNIGNPREQTVSQIAELVIKLTGSKSKIEHKPLPVDDPKVRNPDIRRAKQLLGWEPKVELEDGLRKTIEYFRQAI